MKSINAELGEGKSNICEYCGRRRLPEELNYEAMIHHGAVDLRCIDRKSCERAKRKNKKGK